MEVSHHKLNKYQVIRGNDKDEVEQKARAKAAEWDDIWTRKQAANEAQLRRKQRANEKEQKLALASEMTREAQAEISALENTLSYSLTSKKYTIDWEGLKSYGAYPKAKPVEAREPREPRQTDPKYQPKLGFLDQVFQSRATEKRREALVLFRKAYSDWLAAKQQLKSDHLQAMERWEKARDEYLHKQNDNNIEIDKKRDAFLAHEIEVLLEYFDTVLSTSKYPDYFPQTFEWDYEPTAGRMVVDYQLPDSVTIPTLQEVRYIQTRDEFTENHLPKGRFNKLYDDLLYQITLRTMHELFEADIINAITYVIFNGYVTSIDPATGQEMTACILSIQTSRQEFQEINWVCIK